MPKTRYRLHTPMLGRPMLVLQVQETRPVTTNIGGYIDTESMTYWRDATTEDVSEIVLGKDGT